MSTLKKDPKTKLKDYSEWNVGSKLFGPSEPSKSAPQYVTDFITFMNNLTDTNKEYNEPSPIKENTQFVGSKVKETIDNLDISDDQKNYLTVLGNRESGLNPEAVGKTGTYKGLYQFGPTALREVGIDESDYMRNIYAQHEAALRLRNINLQRLTPYKKYIGTSYRGIPITENGIAAAAHLLGVGGVKSFFDKGEVGRDGLGTPITEYFKLFA